MNELLEVSTYLLYNTETIQKATTFQVVYVGKVKHDENIFQEEYMLTTNMFHGDHLLALFPPHVLS